MAGRVLPVTPAQLLRATRGPAGVATLAHTSRFMAAQVPLRLSVLRDALRAATAMAPSRGAGPLAASSFGARDVRSPERVIEALGAAAEGVTRAATAAGSDLGFAPSGGRLASSTFGSSVPTSPPVVHAAVDLSLAVGSHLAHVWAAVESLARELGDHFAQEAAEQRPGANASAKARALVVHRHAVAPVMDRLFWSMSALDTLVTSYAAVCDEAADTVPGNARHDGHAHGRHSVDWHDLGDLCRWAAEDTGSLCVDCHGVVPPYEINVRTPSQGVGAGDASRDASDGDGGAGQSRAARLARTAALVADDQVLFALTELLKNAFGSTVERVGALHVDDADPVVIDVAATPAYVGVRISDSGGGFDPSLAERTRVFEYFATGRNEAHGGANEPTYTYSRDFGPGMKGHGVGLPRASVVARRFGGRVSLEALPGHGATAVLVVGRHGNVPDLPREFCVP